MVLLSAEMIADIRQVANTYAKREIERVRKVNQVNYEEIFRLIEKDAYQRELNAGYSGSHGDGGASILREQVAFYKMGRDHLFPADWGAYRLQAERESDPEWAELQRLKKKFGE